MQMKEIQQEILANKKRHNFNITNIEQEFCYLYGELREAYEAYCEKLDTFGEELADVANFTMGIAEIKGIDLATEILKKLNISQKKDGTGMQLKDAHTGTVVQMKETQVEVHKSQVLNGRTDIAVEQMFCNIYGKVGKAYEAYYKGWDTFAEELANVLICLMEIAETNGIDLGNEIIQKVEKNKSRKYKQNELGYMVHL